jgi:hypothetical protein
MLQNTQQRYGRTRHYELNCGYQAHASSFRFYADSESHTAGPVGTPLSILILNTFQNY